MFFKNNLNVFVCLYQELVILLKEMFEKFIPKLLQFKKEECHELVEVLELNSITSLCNLYDALATVENGVSFTRSSKAK